MSMHASAQRISGYRHVVKVRQHRLNSDEPTEAGGDDTAPSPQELLAASLATCTAVTMEMYAARKGWELRDVEVEVEYTPADRGCPTKFTLTLRLPSGLSDEQVRRLKVIATKCPVHRTLDGEVMFDERVERTQLAA
ncbi:MAG: OsmC family protein [Solirubrobacteraceae bacterium]